MQLTLHTDYSFRVLLYLYLNRPDPATVGDISEYYGISRHHLLKVVNNLAHIGLVETIRGKGGGVRLLDRVLQMTAGEILRQLEGNRPLIDCHGGERAPKCAVLPVCRFNSVLSGAMKRFFDELDGYRLEDLVVKGATLK
jgi:Rrf2 family nitric oxide-sensitive transcriptional repressor